MTTDEKEIVDYLKTWRGNFVSAREIARKAGSKERYTYDRGWAIPILINLTRNGIIETDYLGHYRLKPITPKKKRKRTFVSPQFLKILKSCGRSFDSVSSSEEAEDEIFVISTESEPSDTPVPARPANQTAGKVK